MYAVRFAFLLTSQARGPVVDDYCDALPEQAAYDAHLVACAEGHGSEGMVGDVLNLEVCGVVDKAHVDAAGIGRVVMDIPELPFGELRLADDVLDDGCVLDFADTYDGGTEGCGLRSEIADGVCEVMHLLAVFGAVPLPLLLGMVSKRFSKL